MGPRFQDERDGGNDDELTTWIPIVVPLFAVFLMAAVVCIGAAVLAR